MEKRKSNNRKNFVWRTLLLILVSLVLGINVYHWNAKSILGNSLPMPFGYGISVILSGSMEPILYVDDLVLIKETTDVEVGDIIVYQRNGELIIHRIIEIDRENLLTQGDANNVADAPILRSSVKGKMVAHVPWIGKVVLILKTPAGIICMLLLAFILVELSYKQERKDDDAQLEYIKTEIRRLKSEQEKLGEKRGSIN